MAESPLTKTKLTDQKSNKKIRASEISYNMILKAHDWFKCNKRFETSEMYNEINNFNEYLQV